MPLKLITHYLLLPLTLLALSIDGSTQDRPVYDDELSDWFEVESSHDTIKRLTGYLTGSKVDDSTNNRFQVCVSYGCNKQQSIQLTEDEWQSIRALFNPDATSAEEERQQISQVIALIERLAAKQTPVGLDRAKNYQDDMGEGYLDCIAETVNVFHWLTKLEQAQLLQWHRVLEPVYRKGFWSSQHWGVAIAVVNTQQSYVVDAWQRDNGKPAVVQPEAQWHANESIAQ